MTATKLKSVATSNPYFLGPSDINAFQSILQAQGNVGPAQATVNQAQLWNFFGSLNDMAYNQYRLTSIAQLKSWMVDLFNVVISTKSSYVIDGKNLGVPGVYLLYMYYQFNQQCMDPNGYEPIDAYPSKTNEPYYDWLPIGPDGISNAWPWNWFGPGGTSCFKAPTLIPNFYNALSDAGNLLNRGLMLAKGSTETVMIDGVGPAHTLAEIQAFQQSRLDPANWTNSGTFVSNIGYSNIWAEEVSTLKTLLKSTNLDSGSYLYILHLLIAVSASNTTDQALAQTILNTTTSSMEYANDTFCDMLLYLVMMQLRDPLGDYEYNATMLGTAITDLQKSVVATNTSSKIITTALNKQAKILNSDASYPMQDPYNPSIGFDTRLSDTIDALDEARSTMSFS